MTPWTAVISATLMVLLTAVTGPASAAEPRDAVAPVAVQTSTNTGAETATRTTANKVPGARIQACVYSPKPGVGGVNVRVRPNTSAPRIGILQEGQGVFGSCDYVYRGHYDACGAFVNTWAYVYWGNTTGYMAAQCLVRQEV